MSAAIETTVTGLRIPWNLISSELEGLYGSTLLQEFNEIIGYYSVYEHGADFAKEKNTDFTPSDLRFKETRRLINKEARFLFSKHPDVWVNVPYDKEADDDTTKQEAMQQTTTLQAYVDSVFASTNFFSKLLKAAKDCFIGKRVAYFVNFSETREQVMIDFVPSLEFVFETDQTDTSKLTKIVTFYTIKESQNKNEQRIYKKKYWLDDNGACWLNEGIYNGAGDLIDEIQPDWKTRFVDMIPAGVIINDGLTGDLDGVSEVAELEDSESWFSRISNSDIDSERCGMSPVRWAMDVNPNTTKDLRISPGAFWDLASDPNAADGVTGTVGMMEPSLGYTGAVNSTLSRIRSSMHEALDVPDVSPDALSGVVSSGKTLKAIYWGLIVRCDEKMLAWRPAIKHIVELIIEGAKLYPGSAKAYTKDRLPDVEYETTVDNQYPLPDDEADEKQVDLAEVNAQTMSKMAYMKKWRNLTDTEAMQELKQIALEREMLEDSYGNGGMPTYGEEEGMEDEDADLGELEDDTIEDEELDSDVTFENALQELEGLLDGL
jgi:hypothetical protein